MKNRSTFSLLLVLISLALTSSHPITATAAGETRAVETRVDIDRPRTDPLWNWTYAGAPLGNQEIEGILVDPVDEDLWYVSSIQHGLYITRNGGVSWEYPLVGAGIDIEGYQIDPSDPSTVYAAIWDKLYISYNSGLNWTEMYTFPEYIRAIHVSSINHYIYAGPQTDQNDNPGLYRSIDGGSTFTHFPFGVPTHYIICWDIEEDPQNGTLYVSTELANHPQPYEPPLFRSIDSGQTWQDISGTLDWHALKLQVDAASQSVYFQSEGGGLYRSDDFGDEWQPLAWSGLLSVLLDPSHPGRLYGGKLAIAGGGAFFSNDGGHFFGEIGLSGISISSVALNTASTRIYVAGYDSGIWVADVPELPDPDGILVTNTNDSGTNSLREGIARANANAGADTIRFAIPVTDSGYDSQHGTWTIVVQTELPAISDDALCIDGASQAIFVGEDMNESGPEVVLNGSETPVYTSGFRINSSANTIRHLVINGFPDSGVLLHGGDAFQNRIVGNYLGTSTDGDEPMPNQTGITLLEAPGNTIGGSDGADRNVISGNDISGIKFIGAGSVGNEVFGNFIGTDATGTQACGNGGSGVFVLSGCASNLIGGTGEGERNVVSANGGTGIQIWGNSNEVVGNHIGIDESGTANLGNTQSGVSLLMGARGNTIGGSNEIAYNQFGVLVSGSDTIENTITMNSIHGNTIAGITLGSGGNTELESPVISDVSYSSVVGTAPPNSTVEIFSDDDGQGEEFEGVTLANAQGDFQWMGLVAGPFVTATATDADGNTSGFGGSFEATEANDPGVETPLAFKLRNISPNPFNPLTTIMFEMGRAEWAEIGVYDLTGRRVTVLADRTFTPGPHTLKWNGSDAQGRAMPSGTYIVRLETVAGVDARKVALLR